MGHVVVYSDCARVWLTLTYFRVVSVCVFFFFKQKTAYEIGQ